MKKKTANSPFIILSACCILILSLFSFNSCIGYEKQPEEDTATQGRISVSADESLQPLIEAQVEAFQGIYKYAKINVSYKPETNCMADLLNDSARIIVITRELLPDELKVFKGWEITPGITKIAYDAIAVITNPGCNDTLIREASLLQLLEGKITKWNELVDKSKNSATVQVVFDHKNGGITRYMIDRLPGKRIASKNVFAVNNTREVVDYVSKNKNALGFINMAWISDIDDSITDNFLSSIKVAEVSPLDTSEFAGYHYKPYLSNIALKMYPFIRNVTVISKEARTGLGTGFTRFMSSDRGQRIVLKAGMLPATMPIRLVQIENKDIQIGKN